MYTATEDRINVLIVGRSLRQTLCNVMYVFTLMQSHTHVDTVQIVFFYWNNHTHRQRRHCYNDINIITVIEMIS